jgi:hypothetical protein
MLPVGAKLCRDEEILSWEPLKVRLKRGGDYNHWYLIGHQPFLQHLEVHQSLHNPHTKHLYSDHFFLLQFLWVYMTCIILLWINFYTDIICLKHGLWCCSTFIVRIYIHSGIGSIFYLFSGFLARFFPIFNFHLERCLAKCCLLELNFAEMRRF